MKMLRFIAFTAALAVSSTTLAQKREFSFAYDQPRTSAYGFGADFFDLYGVRPATGRSCRHPAWSRRGHHRARPGPA